MDLKTYIADPAVRKALAEKMSTDPGYLWQIATAWRGKRASPKFARAIEDATEGVVTAAELRPDLWVPGTKAA